jgi:hypothetical protein
MKRRFLRFFIAVCGLVFPVVTLAVALLPMPAAAAHTQTASTNWTLLDLSNSGPLITDAFSVAPEWAIWYAYDCTKSKGGGAGFVMTVQGGRFVAPIVRHDWQGSSTYYVHDAGTYYLEIRSRCRWHVKVSNQEEVE